MLLYIRQHILTLGEKFSVYNEDGEEVFHVEGSFLSIPKRFTIYDRHRDVVCTIKKEFLTFLPRYLITTSDQSIQLTKSFTFFFNKYAITGRDWSLEGDFFAHEYQVTSGDRPILSISKKWFTIGDSYELRITHKEDALMCLAIVIAVDADITRARNSNN